MKVRCLFVSWRAKRAKLGLARSKGAPVGSFMVGAPPMIERASERAGDEQQQLAVRPTGGLWGTQSCPSAFESRGRERESETKV